MRRPGKLVLVLNAFAALACQYDPYAHTFTTKRPDVGAVQGEYVIDLNATRAKTCRINGNSTATIVLSADGTFEVRDMLACWMPFRRGPGPEVDSAHGSWDLVEDEESWWAVLLRIREMNGATTDYGMPLMLRSNKPPYLLHITRGDPDSGHALVFRRLEGSGSG